MKTNIKPAEIKFLDSLVTLDSAGRRPDFGDKINAVPPRFYNESGEFILNKKGDFFLESYIKIVDHYDEAGTPLLDAFIKNNDLLPLFTKNEYNQDGTRKDFLKGFVSLKDWTDFINSITVLAIQAKGEQKRKPKYNLRKQPIRVLLASNIRNKNKLCIWSRRCCFYV